MSVTLYSASPSLATSTYVYSDPGLTTPAAAGYYSDGTNYYVVGAGGLISSVSACPIYHTYLISNNSYISAAAACASSNLDITFTVYGAQNTSATVSRFYTDTALTIGFTGTADYYKFYKVAGDQAPYTATINGSGFTSMNTLC